MTAAEFKRKWARFRGKESSAYQGHFDDLCRLLGQPTPTEADPTGNEVFCYQKRVLKDLELFEMPDSGDPTERGFADVWKKGCFGWEYKGKKKDLDEAYRQLLRYREALLNPPLLVVCDFDRYIVKTNFNGTVQETHEFTNEQIDHPENWRILRALFENPDSLKPQRTTEQVTQELAATIAEVARSLQARERVELANAATGEEVSVAQRTNLRIARFLNRIVFCLFAEDTALLPSGLFTEVVNTGLEDPSLFAASLEELFRVMAKGGRFGAKTIRHFNGHLFEESTVFALTEDEIRKLADAAKAHWKFIQPSIMGTLFERALDEDQRAQLGAHYTSETDIRALVEPVLMDPLRREWMALKRRLLPSLARGKGTADDHTDIERLLKHLRSIVVFDPACGSGNFLYVALQLLLDLEKEVVTFGTQLGFQLKPEVGVHQLRAIEINPYAYELAQVTVQVGYLQWRRDNGFDNNRTPILQNLEGFLNEDALLLSHYRGKAKTLKEAQAKEHEKEKALKFHTEREWPKCDVIVGNPPFLGGSRIWKHLGRDYQKALWQVYKERVPGGADLCCYWFEKARQLIQVGHCKRAGLLGTQAIRGGTNREVLKRIKATGDIFFAESDRDWILAGAAVHVSMIGFDDGSTSERVLDGRPVESINVNLTAQTDITKARTLTSNLACCFIGTKKAGQFEIEEHEALQWLDLPNPHGRPNSDVLRPWVNGNSLVTVRRSLWIIDAGVSMPKEQMAGYAEPFKHILEFVKPDRDNNNEPRTKKNFWIHKRPGPELREVLAKLDRCVAVVRHSKHLIFSWLNTAILPDDGIQIFGREDDFFFGVLASRVHSVWALAQGTQVREKESGFRYTPTTCFETFPLPCPTRTAGEAIARSARELNDLRERWINPPEWTVKRTIEFPGTVDGPWARYVVNPKRQGVGTVRYSRSQPRDDGCEGNLKSRTLTNLYNERPAWLDLAHKQLDDAVAAAYAWPADVSDEEILARLLALNLDRAAEEDVAAKTKKPGTSRQKRDDELI